MIRTRGTGERVKEFVEREAAGSGRRSVAAADRLLEEGILDSLGVLELVRFLEDEFGIAIVDEELLPENFESIARITAFVEEKRRVSDAQGGANGHSTPREA